MPFQPRGKYYFESYKVIAPDFYIYILKYILILFIRPIDGFGLYGNMYRSLTGIYITLDNIVYIRKHLNVIDIFLLLVNVIRSLRSIAVTMRFKAIWCRSI